ncbi:MAG: PEP/pyruvate-binding domain-containing protein [Myxococcota bacterium]
MLLLVTWTGCDGGPELPAEPTSGRSWSCVVDDPDAPFSDTLGCWDDFAALAAAPLDSSISGATSSKTLIDRVAGDTLYFTDSATYPIHWDFARAFLSGGQLPYVPDLGTFNLTEYYSPDRRFVLGAVTYYEGPDVFVYEIAPYDTAEVDMITDAYRAIRDHSYFGEQLFFHPTSSAIEDRLADLPGDVAVITTDELFAGVDYQPYNLGITTGLLRFYSAEEVDGTYVPFRELVVLDGIPNDISIVAGIVTSDFQTPLAHINVLSVNRGTPNMGLRNADQDEALRALEGKWVELDVGPFEYTVREITEAEADAWWESHKPAPLTVPVMDLTVTDLRSVEDIVVDGADLPTEIEVGLTRFGSKGTNYSALYDIGEAVPIQDAFVIPFAHYRSHMERHGLQAELEAMMVAPGWSDPAVRAEKLEALKVEIVAAPLDAALVAEVLALGAERFPGSEIRFRSSTNAEDLGTFTGAGLYNSQTGDPSLTGAGEGTVEWAIKEAWSNLWNPRAYEERDYYSIDQTAVGMALLTTPNFPDEEANGVAVTNNLFDTSGLEPAFYVNVQIQDFEVVQPALGVVPDVFLHFFYTPGEPVTYIGHSNLMPPGETVLTPAQIHDLGVALDAIHTTFYPVYGAGSSWYGMDVEFKFDDKDTPGVPTLYIKQARPFPWDPSASGAD